MSIEALLAKLKPCDPVEAESVTSVTAEIFQTLQLEATETKGCTSVTSVTSEITIPENETEPEALKAEHASPRWLSARDGLVLHLKSCRSCNGANSRYCEEGEKLRQTYSEAGRDEWPQSVPGQKFHLIEPEPDAVHWLHVQVMANGKAVQLCAYQRFADALESCRNRHGDDLLLLLAVPDCTRALLAGELATLLKEYNANG